MSSKRQSVFNKGNPECLEDEEDERPATFKATLKDLAETSSLHGISKIVHSRQIIVKVLWGLLTVGAFAVFTIQLYNLFKTFYSYPSQTSVSLEFSPIAFPAITLCNMNPVRKSQLYKAPTLERVLKSYEDSYVTGSGLRKKRETDTDKQKTSKGMASESLNTHDKGHRTNNENMVSSNIGQSLNDERVTEQGYFDKPDVVRKKSLRQVLNGRRRFRREEGDSSAGITPSFSAASTLTNPVSEASSNNPDVASITSTPNSQSTVIALATVSSSGDPPVSGHSAASVSSTPMIDGVASSSLIQPSTVTTTLSPVTSASSASSFNSYAQTTTTYYSTTNPYRSSSAGSYSAYSSYSSYSSYSYSGWSSWWPDYDYDYSASSWSSWSDSYSGHRYFYEQIKSSKDEWDERVNKFRQVVKNESLLLRNEIGHQKEDMILSATFAARVQNISQFKTFMSTEYGNCYTISSPKYIAWRSGPAHGIKLTLNLELDEYVDNFSTGYGIRIVFHEPGTHPLPSHEGITLSPGTETNIGLRMVSISRLDEPHGDCIDGSEFASRYGKRYSISACYEFCRISKAMQDCECIPVEAPDDVRLNTTVLPICDDSEIKVQLCLLNVDVMFDNGQIQCDCRGPCKETAYAKTMSSTYWPSDEYLGILLSEICEQKNTTDYWYDVCHNFNIMDYWELDKYRYNFLRVLVYYEDLNYESITEEPVYESVRFLSDIGGAMGLFLGASVLSFVEAVQLVLEVFLYFKHKGEKRNRVEHIKT